VDHPTPFGLTFIAAPSVVSTCVFDARLIAVDLKTTIQHVQIFWLNDFESHSPDIP